MTELLGSLSHSLHLYPIVGLAVFAIALMAERYVALFVTLPMSGSKKFVAQLRDLVADNRIDEAVALCERNRQKPMARLIGQGLARAHQGEASVRNALELSLSESVEQISRRTPFLATLANVSTLLGLCGTVMGLMRSFGSISEVSAQLRGAAMATGISTAMNSTLFGLGVAVVCMIAYSILSNRAGKLTAELERSAIVTLDLVIQSYLEDSKPSSRVA